MDDKTDTESEPEFENKQDVSDGESRPKSKKPENCVWRYFNKLKPYNQKKAECKVCFQIYSYKTTTSNLKCHFGNKHANIVKDNEDFMGKAYINKLKSHRDSASKLKKFSSVNEQKLQYIDLARDDYGNDSDDGVKLTSQIWSQFNHDDDQPTCNLCRELVSSRLEDMKNHLEENHPGVLDHITAEAFDATSEGDLMADDTFTEVVYLEEEQNKVNKSKRTKYHQRDALNIQESNKRKRFKQRNHSESSEETQKSFILKPKILKTNSPDELGVFMNYLKVLLQKVPEENSLKLHLDIINLVMKATPPPQSLVAEKSITAISSGTDTMQGKSRLNPKPKITDDKITPRLVTISTNTEPQPRFIINYKLQNE